MPRMGNLAIILHSHIPYCRKSGVWPFGEEWVFEAMAETYIPVLDLVSSAWQARGSTSGAPFLTMSFTPVLAEQLADDYMKSRFLDYLEMRALAAERDVERHEAAHDDARVGQARWFAAYYARIKERFTGHYRCDLLSAVSRLATDGAVELLATAATHAYLPLLGSAERVYTQISLGCEACEHHFGVRPRGAWLPECGYRPGAVERALEACGIQYFVVDTHAIAGGSPRNLYTDSPDEIEPQLPSMSTMRPYRLAGSKLSVFGRDESAAAQVWSKDHGYPGDGDYREFHRRDEVSGLPYWRVTSKLLDLGQKQLYNREAAISTVKGHAAHFAELVRGRLAKYSAASGGEGIVVAPYDMELFGHWWHEGVEWLAALIDIVESCGDVCPSTLGRHLELHPPTEEIAIPESSWGMGGKHAAWLNHETEWMWTSLLRAEKTGDEIAAGLDRLLGEERETALQALRELLLLEASDWPFLVTTGQAREYAEERFAQHLADFQALTGKEGARALERARGRDLVFDWVEGVKL